MRLFQRVPQNSECDVERNIGKSVTWSLNCTPVNKAAKIETPARDNASEKFANTLMIIVGLDDPNKKLHLC
jgi:hypothetical protein